MYRIDYRGYQVTLECINVDITNKVAGWIASARITARDARAAGLLVRVPGRYASEREAVAAAMSEVQLRLVEVENQLAAAPEVRQLQAGIKSTRAEGRPSCRTSSCVTRDAKP